MSSDIRSAIGARVSATGRSAARGVLRFPRAVLALLVVFVLFSVALLAQAPSSAVSPWEEVALNVCELFHGPLGTALAIVAIVVAGLMWTFSSRECFWCRAHSECPEVPDVALPVDVRCRRAFPLMSGTPFLDLVDDLRLNGMTNPLLVIGDFLLDGRNRVLAGLEAGLALFPVKELPVDVDAIALVASLNMHRHHLTATQRSTAAATLLDLSRRAYRAKYPDTPGFDDESPAGAEDPLEGSVSPSSAHASAGLGEEEGVESSPGPDPLEENGQPLTVQTVADRAGVAPKSVRTADSICHDAPELREPMRDGVINLNDANRIRHETEDVRRQAVADVVAGTAPSAVKAIRARFDREPVEPDPADSPDSPTVPPASSW